MEKGAPAGVRPKPPPRAAENVLPWAEDLRLGAPGDTPAWAISVQPESLSDLELSEEQWLQISKELVDLQLTIHQLREQHEAQIFELKSEVLRLESRVLELELHREQGSWGQHQAPAQGHSNDQRLQDALRRHQTQPKDFMPLKSRQQKLQNPQLGEAERALELQRAQQQVLEMRVEALGRQLQRAQEEARAAGQRVATQARVLSACQGQLHQAEAKNSQLQIQLKKLNEQYVIRLQHYAQDMADYANGAGQAPATAPLRAFLEATLEDIRAAHRSREKQLARAARTYHKRLADLSCRHKELLAIHSVQQAPSQVLADPTMAPWPSKAVLDAATWDLKRMPMYLAAELGPLWEEKAKLEMHLWMLQAQKGPSEASLGALEPQQHHLEAQGTQPERGPWSTPHAHPTHRGLDAASWAQIHQKLQDFSRGTQVVGKGLGGPHLCPGLTAPPAFQAELEQERAQLLVRATAAEAQLSELQEYVDQHLSRWANPRASVCGRADATVPSQAGDFNLASLNRYKQEILTLRKLVGTGDPSKVGAVPPAKPPRPRTHNR
ncbi:coiled-coil domain-containing protein 78 isoform X10 [Elephas maximus indicus]|uniref:coiled-coil domain-containing protein 78 isoform X10 n=1 Tax=Elephas maximus indicus TaxID=99487 RepID=UPI002116E1BD|nr:coiled-coil domain-containing protein 78 isoform X10 [Elephas maximus indicus]